MIENAEASGVFELVHDGQVTLRHVGSGMICHFARDGEGGRLILYPNNLPRGDDVACEWRDGQRVHAHLRYALSVQFDAAGTDRRSGNRDTTALWRCGPLSRPGGAQHRRWAAAAPHDALHRHAQTASAFSRAPASPASATGSSSCATTRAHPTTPRPREQTKPLMRCSTVRCATSEPAEPLTQRKRLACARRRPYHHSRVPAFLHRTARRARACQPQGISGAGRSAGERRDRDRTSRISTTSRARRW